MDRAPKQCVLCGSDQRRRLVAVSPWTVYRCMECGLGVLDPRPSAAELARLYDEKYCHERFVDGGEPGSAGYRRRLGLETHRLRFFRPFKRAGRVLDVGCGYGYFLAACKERGYDVHGLDFSEWAARHASDRLGIPVTVGGIDAVSLPQRHFDVITLWHALEHMADPARAIMRIESWLKPDGVLVVDVPNHLGTDAVRQGIRWNGWDLPFHLFHFTPAALTRLLARFGFVVRRRKNYHSETVKDALKRYPLIGLLARPIAKLYSGHSIAVAAVRRETH
jgi:2-polyprenyl-3-methyl-5-hydroxy-6-metoxy-1,4-benzoquinol methylase